MSTVRDLADYQRAYAASDFEPVQARLRKRQLLATLDAWRPRRILEVGCGSDPLFAHWTNFDRFVVVEPGTGFAREAMAAARGDARVQVVQATMEEVAPALAGECFDAIIASGLLHEVPDALALLRALAAHCSTETRVHVNVPNARSLHRLLALEMGLIGDLFDCSDNQRRLQQPRTFDLDRLAALCHDAGFDLIGKGSYFVKPFTHAQMSQLQGIGLMSERMLDGLWGLEKHLPGLGSEIYVDLQLSEGRS